MAESEEEEVPTWEVEEEEEKEAPPLKFSGNYRSTASDVEGVVGSIVAFASEQMKKSGKFTYGDILMLKLNWIEQFNALLMLHLFNTFIRLI